MMTPWLQTFSAPLLYKVFFQWLEFPLKLVWCVGRGVSFTDLVQIFHTIKNTRDQGVRNSAWKALLGALKWASFSLLSPCCTRKIILNLSFCSNRPASRLYSEASVGAGWMAGSFAKRYYYCWHLVLAFFSPTCSSLTFPLHPNCLLCTFNILCYSCYFSLVMYCSSPGSHENESVFPYNLLERPHLLWYSHISSGISCLFPVRGRRNLVLQVRERNREEPRHPGPSTFPAWLPSY